MRETQPISQRKVLCVPICALGRECALCFIHQSGDDPFLGDVDFLSLSGLKHSLKERALAEGMDVNWCCVVELGEATPRST
jgi:hypothetical protein